MPPLVLAAFVLGPVVALALVSPRFPAASPVRGQAFYGTAVMAAGIAAASASTLDWGFNFAPNWCSRHHDFGKFNFYETNCRTAVGNSSGALTTYAYLSGSVYFLTSGCRPTFTPGKVHESKWKALTIGVALQKKEELAAIRKELPPSASIPLVCPVEPDKGDPICAFAERVHACQPMGQATRSCWLTAAQATALSK